MADEEKPPLGAPEWSNAADTTPGFSVSRFQPEIQNSYIAATDGYANQKGMFISFMHVPSNSVVSFKAFITAYNENFISSWNSEEVYGRADPIHLFKNTQRKITLAFDIPAASQSEAFENLGRVQKLIQFLYPRYTTLDGGVFAQTISQSPLVRMKMLNLGQSHVHSTATTAAETQSTEKEIKSAFTKPEIKEVKASYKGGIAAAIAEVEAEAGMAPAWPSYTYKSMTDKKVGGEQSPEFGLLGIIDNLTVNHNLESPDGAFEEGPGKVLPKYIDVQVSFTAIHEHVLGWQDDASLEGGSRFAVGAFPYSVDMEGSLPKPETGPDASAIGEAVDPEGLPDDGDGVTDSEAQIGAADRDDTGVQAREDEEGGAVGEFSISDVSEDNCDPGIDHGCEG